MAIALKQTTWHNFQPEPLKSRRACVRDSIAMRKRLSERQIDKTLEDSFPCSDPPAWY